MQNTLVSLLAVTCTDIKECVHGASLVAQIIKNLPAIQETRVQSLGRGDHLDKEEVKAIDSPPTHAVCHVTEPYSFFKR